MRATWTITKDIGSRMKRMAQKVLLKRMRTPSGSTTRRTTHWFQRRFQGRKKRGFKGGRRKGKGKGGKGSGRKRFFKRRKGRSKLADDQTDAWQGEGQWQDGQWHDQSWDDWSWYESEEAYAAKGKGKKGKKGKGKDGKSGSKDGTAQLADAAQSSTTTATTFYVDHLNSLNLSFMATTEEQTSFIAQPLTSTSMVLDLGCTRAMAVGSGITLLRPRLSSPCELRVYQVQPEAGCVHVRPGVRCPVHGV